jgi:hypothetical protein
MKQRGGGRSDHQVLLGSSLDYAAHHCEDRLLEADYTDSRLT